MVVGDGKRPGSDETDALKVSRFLRKPVTRRNLVDAISDVLCLSLPEPALRVVERVAESGEVRPLRILVAEDQKVNQVLVRAFLKDSPHELTLAENGQMAVDLYKADPYDIVFMDVQMPVMDGYAATMAIRAFEKAEGLSPRPVVALTANAMMEDVERSLEAGCNEHLNKPIKKATLLGAIRKYSESIEIPIERAS
jgi:CheY-like chemotaxis protein